MVSAGEPKALGQDAEVNAVIWIAVEDACIARWMCNSMPFRGTSSRVRIRGEAAVRKSCMMIGAPSDLANSARLYISSGVGAVTLR